MENMEELIKEAKERIANIQKEVSGLQSFLSKLENTYEQSLNENVEKDDTDLEVANESTVEDKVEGKVEEPSQLEMPQIKLDSESEQSLEESTELKMPMVDESVSIDLPKIEEPAVDELNLVNEEVKEDTKDVIEESDLVLPEEKTLSDEKLEIKGFKQCQNAGKIKEYFNSEELKNIIVDYENMASEEKSQIVLNSEEQVDESVQETSESKLINPVSEETITPVKPDSSMPSDLVSPIEEKPQEETSEEVTENVHEEPKLINPVVEEKKLTSEEVAKNLANNFGEEKRMRTVEEMLAEMEQKFEEGKVRQYGK